jgi:serine/threonine-protein kinase
MSPEQVTGRELDARSDLFTAAIVLAELVTLRPLFSGGSEIDVLMRIRDADLSQLDRSAQRIPDDLKGVLFKALARDRAQRYSTAQEFAEALEDIVRRRRLQVGPAKLAAWVERLRLGADSPDPEPEVEETPTRELEPSSVTLQSVPPAQGPVHDSQQRSSAAPPPAAGGEVAPSIYRVKMRDGTVIGPLAYPRLVELFVTGRVHPDCEIARETGAFKDARAFPELHRFVSSSALRWDSDIPRGAALRGLIERRTLPSRLFALAINRETGALHMVDGTRKKKVYFVEGVPEFVASTDKSELLGEQLVKRGQVLRMEVDMALAMLPRFGGRLGDALVGLGVLRPIELFRAIADQTQGRFVELFDWRQGEIAFVRGARSHEETFPLGIDTVQLVARGVREHYTDAEIGAIMAGLEGATLAPVVPLPVRIEAYRLASREERVIRAVEREITLAALIQRLAESGVAERADVERAVFLGLSCDLLRSPSWSADLTPAR